MFISNIYKRLILGVIILYGLALAIAMLAPVIHGDKMSLICTSTGYKFVQLDYETSDPSTKEVTPSITHLLDCSLCVAAGILPNIPLQDAIQTTHALSYALRSIPSARLASLVSLPPPARGPPSFIF